MSSAEIGVRAAEPQEAYFAVEPRPGFIPEDYRPHFKDSVLIGISVFYYPIEEGTYAAERSRSEAPPITD